MRPHKQFARADHYAEQVAIASSTALSWTGLSLVRARELSAEVTFEAFERNLINVTLTGTLRHEARFADIREGHPTRAGEVLRVPAGVPGVFAFDAPPGGEQSLICLFDHTLFEDYCPDACSSAFFDGIIVPSPHRAMPRLSTCLQMLSEELSEVTARGPLYAETMIRLIAMEIAANAWSVKPSKPPSRQFTPEQIRLIQEVLNQPLHRDLSLSTMAACCGMSIGGFSRAFKSHFGRTPYAHVKELRLMQAVKLLSNSNLPLIQIALETGFYDQQHLSRSIRQRFGRTPSEIRRGST